MNIVFGLLLLVVGTPVAYLCFLALAAIPSRRVKPGGQPSCRFAVVIPAHNEEPVIGLTVATMRQMDYPSALYDVFVVADHCTDETARAAREAGALVHERGEEPRGSKGAALRWLMRRILQDKTYEAVVLFDADTRAEPDFLRIMSVHLAQGEQVIQGQHRICNPTDGWFPMLTWAMFLVDNRLQNQSRSNLGWSAKNMGDSICFRADLLHRLEYCEGLTEDSAFRQQLLLEGIRIRYEPSAIGWGEAALNWSIARAQRARWLRGSYDAGRMFAGRLLSEGLRKGNLAMLDGALQSYMPSYSTLTIVAILSGLLQAYVDHSFPAAWIVLALVLLLYPFWGLALEKAPARAYLAILSGPVFIIWRTRLALASRFGRRNIEWVRTPRKPRQPGA